MNHKLTPIYTPVSWGIAEPDDPPDADFDAAAKMLGEAMRAVVDGRAESFCTGSANGYRRPRLADIMGDDFVEGLTLGELDFITAMFRA